MKHIPPFPAEADYYREACALDDLMVTPASVGRAAAMVNLARAYTTRTALLGEAMSPHDRGARMAFVTGSMAGLALAWRAHGSVVDGLNMAETLNRQQLSERRFEQGSSRRAHLVTSEVAHAARRGHVYLGEQATQLTNEWGWQTMPNKSAVARFRQGIGLTALLANQLHLYRDLKSREQGIHDFDWDAALRQIAE